MQVIRLYFAGPDDGGHGYTLGRVPINSCDFSPGSYSFDDVSGDTELEHFDTSVQHDVDVGMIPMMLDAKAAVEARGYRLNIYASPWSPPAWMKEPVFGVQSMVVSATPNGLMPSMQRVWAQYFSKFISAYRERGIELWGVTVQNEPEAAVGWEACLWTPDFMAEFVRDHLGPLLEREQPGVKIIGFDHNKDHVALWAKGLYADPKAARYFYGIGVHWYGGLNTHNLNYTHYLDPSKVILGTEACNCGGVVFRTATFKEGILSRGDFLSAWWSRAESLALDILEDLRFWAVGWTDWNLLLNPSGGPNHLKNLCDANIIADPTESLGMGTLILQASFFYMGHFSRYLPPGSKRIGLSNSVELHAPPLEPSDVKNGQAVLFAPCDGNDAQKWQIDESGMLTVRGTNEAEASDGYQHGGECVDYDPKSWIDGKLQVWACAHSTNQQWQVNPVKGGSQIVNPASGKCMTAVQTSGVAVGLDAGVTIVAAQLKPCQPTGSPNQTFVLANYDAQGFPSNFPVRTLPSAPGSGELCLQPQIVRLPHFDAVAFETPEGSISLVALNIGDNAIDFTLVDKASKNGLRQISIPPHAIQTYRWTPDATLGSQIAIGATSAAADSTPADARQQSAQTWAAVGLQQETRPAVESAGGRAKDHIDDRTNVDGLSRVQEDMGVPSVETRRPSLWLAARVVLCAVGVVSLVAVLRARSARGDDAWQTLGLLTPSRSTSNFSGSSGWAAAAGLYPRAGLASGRAGTVGEDSLLASGSTRLEEPLEDATSYVEWTPPRP